MRWPKKREFISFYVLSEKFMGEVVPFNLLVSFLMNKLGFSGKVSKNIVKRLVSLGYIVRLENGYLVRSYREVLNEFYVAYVVHRRK